tara:strand:+ start:460 stop:693 length:234 start_codon:yes stop_codon:yes gene_type:complete
MTLDQFLSLAETHTISADEAQSLNMFPSKAPVDDTPEQQRGVILDYLVVALNMNPVDPKIAPSFDDLRTDLENSGTS